MARMFVFSQVASASSAEDFLSEEKSCAAKITEKPSERAWAGALTLIVLVMLLNLLGRFALTERLIARGALKDGLVINMVPNGHLPGKVAEAGAMLTALLN